MTGIRAAHLRLLAALLAVPALAAGAQGGTPPAPAASRAASAAVAHKLVDINHASRAQLKTLPGIGDAEAERIVAGRPYLSKAELVTRQVLPAGVYQALRHRMVALQDKKNLPGAKK